VLYKKEEEEEEEEEEFFFPQFPFFLWKRCS
jgi:hypothetical protein